MRKIMLLLALLIPSHAWAQDECGPLTPKGGEDFTEEFRGNISGELEGALSRIVSGSASIEGEYKRIINDTIKDYPEANKVFVWQSIIYLACVRPNSGIDINKLFELYLIGPPKQQASSVYPEFSLSDVGSKSKLIIENVGGQISALKTKNLLYMNIQNNFCSVERGNAFFRADDLGRIREIDDQSFSVNFRGELTNSAAAIERIMEGSIQDDCIWWIDISLMVKMEFQDRTGKNQTRYIEATFPYDKTFYSSRKTDWEYNPSRWGKIGLATEEDWERFNKFVNSGRMLSIELGDSEFNTMVLSQTFEFL